MNEVQHGEGYGAGEKALARILIEELGYQGHSAEVTAHDLLHFSAPRHDDLDAALARWAQDRSVETNVSSGRIDVPVLRRRGLTYPAALIFIDWHRSDPETAEQALRTQM